MVEEIIERSNSHGLGKYILFKSMLKQWIGVLCIDKICHSSCMNIIITIVQRFCADKKAVARSLNGTPLVFKKQKDPAQVSAVKDVHCKQRLLSFHIDMQVSGSDRIPNVNLFYVLIKNRMF